MPYAIAFDDEALDVSDARFGTASEAKTACRLTGLESAYVVRVSPRGEYSRLRPAKRIRAIGPRGTLATITYGEACRVYRMLMNAADMLAAEYPHASDPMLAAYDDAGVERRVFFSIVRRVAESDMRAESLRESPTYVEKMQRLYARDKACDIDNTLAELHATRIDRLRAIRYARLTGQCSEAMENEALTLAASIDVEPKTENGADIENAICDAKNVPTSKLPASAFYTPIDVNPVKLNRVRIMRDKRARRNAARKSRIVAEREYRRLVYSRKESLPVARELIATIFPSRMPDTLQWPMELTSDIRLQRERDRVQRENAAPWCDWAEYDRRRRCCSVREYRRLTGNPPSLLRLAEVAKPFTRVKPIENAYRCDSAYARCDSRYRGASRA